MSYATLNASSRDQELIERLKAAIAKEAWANEVFGATVFGKLVRERGPDEFYIQFIWPLCINSEADYEYAINTDNVHPGGEGVITDTAIGSVVQAHWPADTDPQD